MTGGNDTKLRFMDINIHNRTWYLNYSLEEQHFWDYMNKKASDIGIYEHHKEKTKLECKVEMSFDEIFERFNSGKERVKKLDESRILLIDFLEEQHCRKEALLPKSKVNVSYMKKLIDAKLYDYFYRNNKRVVSEDSYAFFRAFELGELKVRSYSNSKESIDPNTNLTPYDKALSKALSIKPESNNDNVFGMPSLYHQGKGTGKGIGKSTGTG